MEAKERLKSENKLSEYRPYNKQREFHDAGAKYRERLFMAGNQLGKTWAGGFEAAMHLTGIYPDDWQGRRFTSPIKAWVAGVTGESTRDNPQRVLMGDVGQQGAGTIPLRCIGGYTLARGVSNLLDTVRVKHVSGGYSILSFKAYEKGREKWQGETLDLVWFDEEPPLDIYTEGLTRTNVRAGIVFVTFTPLLGMSDTVMRFIGEAKAPNTHVTNMTIMDAEHYTQEQREAIIASYPAHEREARINGTPMLGSGRIFTVPEESLYEGRIEIPAHWPRIIGMDFGADHPTAAVWMAWDRDRDTVHVYDCYRKSDNESEIRGVNLHAPVIRSKGGDKIPIAWPHDGLQHDKGSGEELATQYRNAGLNMLPERATFSDGGNGVEAGIMDMLTRMESCRFYVAEHLKEWFEEYRMYHRKDGKVVKERDDLMAATRYGVMMLRFAEVKERVKPLNYRKLGTV